MIFWLVITFGLSVLLRLFSTEETVNLIVAGRVGTGVLLTTVLYFCYRHRFTRSLSGGFKLLWILALNLTAAAISSVIWILLVDLGLPEIPTASLPSNLFIARVCSLIIWNFGYFGTELILDHHVVRIEASEARVAARTAELRQLHMQLNPHFLFNALNTVIASLEPGHQTREIVKNLADYLRFALQEARPLEPLRREFDALESYFELQRVRFQDGLHCEIAGTPAAMRVMVPPMLVQPLLENAFKYGPMSSPMPLRVDVEARVVDGWLVIRVTNTGDWVVPGSVDSHGSGVASIRRRLLLLIGEAPSLRVEAASGSVCVTIRIPCDH